MKSLYLIFAAAAVAVTSEPQRTNNDIIWYPVDDEEGVFISSFGEKHRTTQDSKWRSHRRARYSGAGLPLPLSYDPTENQDPSFFHNINERRPFTPISPIPKLPPAFQNQEFPVKRPNKRPLNHDNQNVAENTFQEIFNEVFDYSKHPSVSEFPGIQPESINQWGSHPITENQSQWSNTGKRPRPSNQNQQGSIGQQPAVGSSNQWGNTVSRPPERPTGSEWFIAGSKLTSTNRPNKRPTNSNRPTNESDKLVFPGEISGTTTTSSDLIPTNPPTMSPCERSCPVTPEFNPVCGSNGITYSNAGRLKCAQMCGKRKPNVISFARHRGNQYFKNPNFVFMPSKGVI